MLLYGFEALCVCRITERNGATALHDPDSQRRDSSKFDAFSLISSTTVMMNTPNDIRIVRRRPRRRAAAGVPVVTGATDRGCGATDGDCHRDGDSVAAPGGDGIGD